MCINIGAHVLHWLPGCPYIAVDTEQPSAPYHYYDSFAEYVRGASAVWCSADVAARTLSALSHGVPVVALPVLLGALTDRGDAGLNASAGSGDERVDCASGALPEDVLLSAPLAGQTLPPMSAGWQQFDCWCSSAAQGCLCAMLPSVT